MKKAHAARTFGVSRRRSHPGLAPLANPRFDQSSCSRSNSHSSFRKYVVPEDATGIVRRHRDHLDRAYREETLHPVCEVTEDLTV